MSNSTISQHWSLFALVLLAVLAGGGTGGRAQGVGPSATVTLTVRGPDGRPLRDHTVTVYRMDTFQVGDTVASATTDGQGRVTVTVPPSRFPTSQRLRLRVAAPGVGFGGTGGLALGPDGRAAATLPPLCPFARLSGTVAPALRRPGQTVRVQNNSQNKDQGPAPAPVDAQGRFRLTDLPPGQVGLTLGGGGGPDRYFGFQLAPGESRADAVLSAPPTEKNGGAGAPPFFGPPPTRTVTLVGTVTDDQGRPVAGADVYAQVPTPRRSYGISTRSRRQAPPPLSTVTGADGGYVFSGVTVADDDVTTIPLAAAAAGHPPAVAFVRTAQNGTDDLRGDLFLSTRHTALTVRITGADGRPAAGARVGLRPTAGIPGLVSASGAGGQSILDFGAGVSLQDLFVLNGTTGPDGTARFADLLPGLWDVAGSAGTAPGILSKSPPDYRSGGSQGVAVQAGRGASCAFTLSPGPAGPTVRVLGPNGSVVPIQNATLEPGNAAADTQVSALRSPDRPAGPFVDPDGDTPVPPYLVRAGLWRVTANYGEVVAQAGMTYYPGITDPYNEAGALVALSPALPPPGLLVLHTRPRRAGSLRVRLLGADGKPAVGAVFIPDPAGSPAYAAAVGARGEAVFADMPAGTYAVTGSLAGQTTPPTLFGKTDAPLPPDAALTGQSCVVSDTAEVTLDAETLLVLRARPAGFVRGRLVPAAGTSLRDYSLAPRYAPRYGETDAAGLIDAQTGEFVYGPLPPGPATLAVQCQAPTGGRPATAVTLPVDVIGGQVTRLTPTTVPPLPPGAGLPDPEVNLARGTILLHDGATPAWGAQAVLFLPRPEFPQYPTLLTPAPADALGRLNGLPGQYGGFYQPHAPASPSAGPDPTGPTLIAWLPGTTGAVLVPYVRGREAHIVLPAPLRVTGRVTVGGQSAAGLPGTIRVRAQYQGRGHVNDLLSLDVTAGPDGTFTLDGLTPGTYLVQAARDGIWLSAAQALTVGDGPLPALTLDIGLPGSPVTLRLAPGQAAALDRPAGPLADLLWPVLVHADGVGDLRLDGLEAGRHSVHPVGGPQIGFDVPAAGPRPIP